MKAAYIEQTGPPEVIQYGELPVPQLAPGQVLVRMEAVSVNPIDTYIRNGANYWELPRPYIVGADLAGTIETIGADVHRFQAGDRVWCTNQGFLGRQGTFAEFCAIDEKWLYPLPQGVGPKTAAACALVGVTAHLGLVREAQLRPGETLLVNGGAGGVGSVVIQLAKALGAKVVATAGSPEKVAHCLRLGADVAANYKTDDVVAAVGSIAPQGANVVWETAREPNFDVLVSYMAERGRLILMAGRDARPPFPVGPFYVKGCSMHGFVMFKASPEELRECATDLNGWMASGRLQAQIGKEFSLSESQEAHRWQEENTLQKKGSLAGKIVLVP